MGLHGFGVHGVMQLAPWSCPLGIFPSELALLTCTILFFRFPLQASRLRLAAGRQLPPSGASPPPPPRARETTETLAPEPASNCRPA